MNDENTKRLEADAEGHDIVGLRPGQKFDPLGDALHRLNEQLVAEGKEPIPTEPEAAPLPEPPEEDL